MDLSSDTLRAPHYASHQHYGHRAEDTTSTTPAALAAEQEV
jgi:hypothetical protein